MRAGDIAFGLRSKPNLNFKKELVIFSVRVFIFLAAVWVSVVAVVTTKPVWCRQDSCGFCRSSSHLVEELPQGLVALALVADLGDGDAAGARVDVGRAVLLARVVEVAGLGGVQAVVLLGGRRFR